MFPNEMASPNYHTLANEGLLGNHKKAGQKKLAKLAKSKIPFFFANTCR